MPLRKVNATACEKITQQLQKKIVYAKTCQSHNPPSDLPVLGGQGEGQTAVLFITRKPTPLSTPQRNKKGKELATRMKFLASSLLPT